MVHAGTWRAGSNTGLQSTTVVRNDAIAGIGGTVSAVDAGRPPPARTEGVEIIGVTKGFGSGATSVRALDDVSLTVPGNAFFTLLGPSGCGKTTLLRILGGFEHADAGRVLLAGREVAGDPPNKRPVNTVFQSYALFPHMSVGQNIAFGLERQGLGRAAVAARVAAMLRLVRLEGMAERRPNALSGGQQQRVALARALAPSPKLLLLDEPLSALDVKLRHGMQRELKRIQRETGVTFLLVTHDQEEALSLSDCIAVMDRGRVLQVDSPEAIFERPRSRFVADFMGSNVLPGALVGADAAHVAVRPERIAIGTVTGPGDLVGGIIDLTYRGGRTSRRVALDAGPTITIEQDGRVPPGADFGVGQRVACRVPRDALTELDA